MKPRTKTKPKKQDWRKKCAECGKPCGYDDFYMVHDALWHEIADDSEQLHIKCLEKRMGRRLELSDLTTAPLNIGLRIHMGDLALDPNLPEVKMIRWNQAKTWMESRSATLAVGTIVKARVRVDPEGADVKKGTLGFVLGETNCFDDNCGPFVIWITGARCNVYPELVEAVDCDNTVYVMTHHPEAARNFPG